MKNSDAIYTGVFGHKLMEIFYKAIAQGKTKEEARFIVQRFLPANKTQEMIRAWVLVENYILSWEPIGTAVSIERSFVVDVTSDLAIGFTPDLLWLYNDKRLDIEDYKFIQKAWPERKVNRYSQLDIYRALLLRHGLDVRKAYLRFFNTYTGKISYKTYISSQEKLDQIYKEFIRLAYRVAAFKELSLEEKNEQSNRTPNYNNCAYCPFEYPCNLELDGKSAEMTLRTQYSDLEYGYESRFEN